MLPYHELKRKRALAINKGTSKIAIGINLDASDWYACMDFPKNFTRDNLPKLGAFKFSVAIQIFDLTNQARVLTLYFSRHISQRLWYLYAGIDDNDVTPRKADGTPLALKFDDNGDLISSGILIIEFDVEDGNQSKKQSIEISTQDIKNYGGKHYVAYKYAHGGLTGSSLQRVSDNANNFHDKYPTVTLQVEGSRYLVFADLAINKRVYQQESVIKLAHDYRLVNEKNQILIGFITDAHGQYSNKEDIIKMPWVVKPRATTKISYHLALDARSQPPINDFLPKLVSEEPTPTRYTYKASSQFYGELGEIHCLNVYFIKTKEPHIWQVYVYIGDVCDITPEGKPFVLVFKDGRFLPKNKSTDLQSNQVSDEIKIHGWFSQEALELDFSAVTEIYGTSNITNITQDGYKMGILQTFAVQADGSIIAKFDNQCTIVVGNLALASFSMPDKLLLQENFWLATPASGLPILEAVNQTSNRMAIKIEHSGQQLGSLMTRLDLEKTKDAQMPIALSVSMYGPGFIILRRDNYHFPVYKKRSEFNVDANGYLANQFGDKLLGLMFDPLCEWDSDIRLKPIQVPLQLAPKSTQYINVKINLNPNANINSFNEMLITQVYDSLGQEYEVKISFIKIDVDTWKMVVCTEFNHAQSEGIIKFNIDGTIKDWYGPVVLNGPVNGSSKLYLNLQVTQNVHLAGRTKTITQDGNKAYPLQYLSLYENGTVNAHFTGTKITKVIGQVRLANFLAPSALANIDDATWQETVASGNALIGVPSTAYDLGFLAMDYWCNDSKIFAKVYQFSRTATKIKYPLMFKITYGAKEHIIIGTNHMYPLRLWPQAYIDKMLSCKYMVKEKIPPQKIEAITGNSVINSSLFDARIYANVMQKLKQELSSAVIEELEKALEQPIDNILQLQDYELTNRYDTVAQSFSMDCELSAFFQEANIYGLETIEEVNKCNLNCVEENDGYTLEDYIKWHMYFNFMQDPYIVADPFSPEYRKKRARALIIERHKIWRNRIREHLNNLRDSILFVVGYAHLTVADDSILDFFTSLGAKVERLAFNEIDPSKSREASFAPRLFKYHQENLHWASD